MVLKFSWLATPLLTAAAYLILSEFIFNAIGLVIDVNWLYGLSGHSSTASFVWLQILYGISELVAALVVTRLLYRFVSRYSDRHIVAAITFVAVYMAGLSLWSALLIIEHGATVSGRWLVYEIIRAVQIMGIFWIVAILARIWFTDKAKTKNIA